MCKMRSLKLKFFSNTKLCYLFMEQTIKERVI